MGGVPLNLQLLMGHLAGCRHAAKQTQVTRQVPRSGRPTAGHRLRTMHASDLCSKPEDFRAFGCTCAMSNSDGDELAMSFTTPRAKPVLR